MRNQHNRFGILSGDGGINMSEENVEKLIAMIKEEAYVPGEWQGVSEIKVVHLENVLGLIEQLRNTRW